MASQLLSVEIAFLKAWEEVQSLLQEHKPKGSDDEAIKKEVLDTLRAVVDEEQDKDGQTLKIRGTLHEFNILDDDTTLIVKDMSVEMKQKVVAKGPARNVKLWPARSRVRICTAKTLENSEKKKKLDKKRR